MIYKMFFYTAILSICLAACHPETQPASGECVEPVLENDFTLSQKFEQQLDLYEVYEDCMRMKEWLAGKR